MKALFQYDHGEFEKPFLEDISSNEKILETLQRFRKDDLKYSSLNVSNQTKEKTTELELSLQGDEDLDFLKVSLVIFVNCRIILFALELVGVPAKKELGG